uniref:(northern house mosquito) hypothetical protein n=1 Tax=Culex pipiens TaxID=7175 RepID=A0A8D8JTE9_CULPI
MPSRRVSTLNNLTPHKRPKQPQSFCSAIADCPRRSCPEGTVYDPAQDVCYQPAPCGCSTGSGSPTTSTTACTTTVAPSSTTGAESSSTASGTTGPGTTTTQVTTTTATTSTVAPP